MKPNYYVIPALTLAIIILSRYFTAVGLEWYTHLVIPSFTPPYWMFAVAWHVIYLLTMFTALYVWNRFQKNFNFWMIISMLCVNACLNVAWTYFFFYRHMIGAALLDIMALEISLVFLIKAIWPRSKFCAVLLLPYAAWVGFAFILNYAIWVMNITP